MYLEDDVKPRCTEYTVKKYHWNLSRIQGSLKKARLEDLPYKVGRREIEYLLNGPWANLEPSTRSWYLSIYSSYLGYYDNHIVRDMRIRKEYDRRTNVDWLTPQEMATLLEADLTPLERIVIHLELSLGLRKVEVIRLRKMDVKRGYVEVHGKGGKWRTVPFHRDTQKIIDEWLIERARWVAEAKKFRPYLKDPEQLIIYKRYKKRPIVSGYSEDGTGLDRTVIKAVRERYGLEFANHTLRRSFGRALWMTKELPDVPTVPTETIAKLMGHESTTTTIQYIGVNLDDMSAAMAALSSYQTSVKNGKK